MVPGLFQQHMRGLAALFRGVKTPEFSDQLKDFLAENLSFSTFLIVVFPLDQAPFSIYRWIPESRLNEIFTTQYMHGAYLLDPFYQLSRGTFEDRAHRLRDTAPDRFFSSEYYHQYYGATGIIDEVGFFARLENGSVGHLSVSRSTVGRKFDRKNLNYLRQLAPILTELLRQHCEYANLLSDEENDDNARNSHPDDEHRSLDKVIYDFAFTLRPKGLTKREAGVTALILQGHSSASASLVLEISRATVNVHRRNIHRKLNISSQAELFAAFSPAMSPRFPTLSNISNTV